tara:strand:+ start:218 stop:493 length:276 start_codon:yes stop_codon:yes gene_type:complete
MKYARQCDITGEGMNDGYVVGDGFMHIKYEKDLIALIRSWGVDENNELSDDFILNESWQHEEWYWTQWECPTDLQYEEVNGKLIEINQCHN